MVAADSGHGGCGRGRRWDVVVVVGTVIGTWWLWPESECHGRILLSSSPAVAAGMRPPPTQITVHASLRAPSKASVHG